MILVVGGAFQGKKEFVKSCFSIPEEAFVDGSSCAFEEIYQASAVLHFHEYVKRLLREEKDTKNLVEQIFLKNPDLMIVSNELGCGVVPMEAFDRLYRETTGRICTELAARADSVYRVICGIGTRLK